MKIQCDVCHKEEASVFCSADEAALCNGCDNRVHRANKLASQHHRFSLLHPTSCKEAPRCDICQERRAFLFCREDRAILCRECDYNIHTANEHTQKHSRFLLTGVKLSSCTTTTTTFDSSGSHDHNASASPSIENSNKVLLLSNSQLGSSMKKKDLLVSVSSNLDDPPPSLLLPAINGNNNNNSSSTPPYSGGGFAQDQTTPIIGGGSTSSISEYLIEMLPGWHVEDFLDASSSAPYNNHGFCKITDDLLPFLDEDKIQTNVVGHYNLASEEDFATWVPQASPSQIDDRMNGLFKELKEVINPKSKARWIDHGLTVPQISPPSCKRPRPLW